MIPYGFPFLLPLLGIDDAWRGFCLELPLGSPFDARLRDAIPELTAIDPANPCFVAAELTTTAMPDSVIPVFRASHQEDVEQSRLEAEYRKTHRRLALVIDNEQALPATGTWNYILLPANKARTLPPYGLMGLTAQTTVIATGVHSFNDHHWAIEHGCQLTTGEFLQMRGSNGRKADMTQQRMLALLALIADDADSAALEDIFRQEAKLSYSLLRLVNSAAVAPRAPIASFSQAIQLLGRRQLARWLQLLIYADPNNGLSPNPLLHKAAYRGRLLELLSDHLPNSIHTEASGDRAFMAGSFSLLDVLLNLPMSEILQQLPLSNEVRDALAKHAGELGTLLAAIEAADRRDLAGADNLLGTFGLSIEDFLNCQLAAWSWAHHINRAS